MKDKIKIFSKYYTIDDISNNDTNYCLVNIGGVITFVHINIEYFDKFDIITLNDKEYIILGYNLLMRTSITSSIFELTCRCINTNEYVSFTLSQFTEELFSVQKQKYLTKNRKQSITAIIVE